MYGFLKDNWEIARWVALGVVVFEVGDETYPQLLILSKLKDARVTFIFSPATRYFFLNFESIGYRPNIHVNAFHL